jgi:hypothetical protein
MAIEKPDVRKEFGGWRVWWCGQPQETLHQTENAAYGEARAIRRELIRQFSDVWPGPETTMH